MIFVDCLFNRAREKHDVREKVIGCLPYMPLPQPEIEPATFLCEGRCSNQLSFPARAEIYFLYFMNLHDYHCTFFNVHTFE